MANVKELEKAISNLSAEEYKEFREWFETYEAQQWDKQFEEDVEAGKLDAFAQEAIQDYKKGNYSELWNTLQPPGFGMPTTISLQQSKKQQTRTFAYLKKTILILHYTLRK